ncbi:MAG: DUF4469 domain-containing protein [Tannerella sp.]|jgi:hypothetical protein|nr:DUF4469 domain-containing protein [Tannerella sp.]
MTKLFKVFVELYELPLTAQKDDRSGGVVSTGSLKIDDLIQIAVSRRSDINAVTVKASYEIRKEVALEKICNAKLVEFGLLHYKLVAGGVFTGDHASWDIAKNNLALSATATDEVREMVKNIRVEVCGMASSGIFINTLTDLVSGEINSRITWGGGVNISGTRIKIAGDAPRANAFNI